MARRVFRRKTRSPASGLVCPYPLSEDAGVTHGAREVSKQPLGANRSPCRLLETVVVEDVGVESIGLGPFGKLRSQRGISDEEALTAVATSTSTAN